MTRKPKVAILDFVYNHMNGRDSPPSRHGSQSAIVKIAHHLPFNRAGRLARTSGLDRGGHANSGRKLGRVPAIVEQPEFAVCDSHTVQRMWFHVQPGDDRPRLSVLGRARLRFPAAVSLDTSPVGASERPGVSIRRTLPRGNRAGPREPDLNHGHSPRPLAPPPRRLADPRRGAGRVPCALRGAGRDRDPGPAVQPSRSHQWATRR